MGSIIHFEGLPGSGKSTAAERTCQLLLALDIDAHWVLEESRDHPITPAGVRSRAVQPNFADVCLDAWRSYAASVTGIAILDGYALQSTVRFLYANLVPDKVVRDYFRDWLAAGPSSLVYLTTLNPTEHLERVATERGADWTEKLVAYVERTPIGQRDGLRGLSGFVEFWSDYQAYCLALLHHGGSDVIFMEARSSTDEELLKMVERLGMGLGGLNSG